MGEARELGQRWFDTVKSGDGAAAAALLADDFEFVAAGVPASSPEEVAGFVTGYVTSFPDMDFVVRTWVEDGNVAVAEGSYTGTNTGPMVTPMGELPATGLALNLPFTTVFEARDGKLAAHRAYWDNVAFMTQLGLAPPPPQ